MTGAGRSKSSSLRIRSRVSILVGVVLFLVLAGTGVATASWTASGAATVRASAGSLSFTQSGAAALSATYSDWTNIVVSAPITVTNTGTVPSQFTLTVQATTSVLADGVQVSGWSVTDPLSCKNAPPQTAKTGTLTSGIQLSGASLAPQATAYFCIQTDDTSAFAWRTSSASATVALFAQQYNWVSSSVMSFTQSKTGVFGGAASAGTTSVSGLAVAPGSGPASDGTIPADGQQGQP